jgi:hypothetical protein
MSTGAPACPPPQAPLQPLMDNLESQTYETFEKVGRRRATGARGVRPQRRANPRQPPCTHKQQSPQLSMTSHVVSTRLLTPPLNPPPRTSPSMPPTRRRCAAP